MPVALPTQTLAADLLEAVGALRRALRAHVGRPAELSGLTGAQLELARLVSRRPGVSVADAARELHLAPNTVSTLVRQLTAAGVLVRRADVDDRRVARLELEPSLRDTMATWRDQRALALAAAVDRLPAGEWARLERLVDSLMRLVAEVDA